MDLYKSIGENDIEFELVFVGPNQPDYRLPNNFRFIRSFVKPTHRLEIALRNTTADLVMSIADDCLFKRSRPLDRLYETYKNYNNDKIKLSCRYILNGEDLSECAHFDGIGSPEMPLCGLMSRNLLMSIGGIDKKLHRDNVGFGHRNASSHFGSELCNEFWDHDRGLLFSLWKKNGKIHLRRAKPVESFDDLNILKASQGPRGRWRGSGSRVIEKIETNLPRVTRGIRKPSMYLNYARRMALGFMGKL